MSQDHTVTLEAIDKDKNVVVQHVEQLSKEGAEAVSEAFGALLTFIHAPNDISTELANTVARLVGKARKVVLSAEQPPAKAAPDK